MQPVYWFSTGPASKSRLSMVRTFSAYARRATYVKAGITRTPEIRLAAHQRQWAEGHKWDKMVVMYQSLSWSSVCELEDALILHARQSGWSHKLYNQVAGGGGRVPQYSGPYSLYVLVDYKKY